MISRYRPNTTIMRLFSTKTGGQLIYDRLLFNGTKDVFMYSGGAVMPLIDAFYDSKIDYHIHTHEQNCGHAATGYARVSNSPGIVVTTSGPGLTNCITPMLDAHNDSTPLIVLSGQVPLNVIGTLAFQECPATELTSTFTKWSYLLKDIHEIDDVIDYAFYKSMDKKKGVVHIDLPKCILSESIEYNKNDIYDVYKKDSMIDPNIIYSISTHPLRDKIKNSNYPRLSHSFKKISNVIQNSNSPVLYIGQGCLQNADLLRILAKKANIPVTTTIHGMGIFDESDPLALQFIGMHGNPAANKAAQQADCIIAIGARFDDRTVGNIDKYAPIANENNAIIHCNIEETEVNKTVQSHYYYVGECKDFLENIIDNIEYKDRSPWLDQINEWKNDYPFEYRKDNNLRCEYILETLNHIISNRDNVYFTTGVGNHQMQTAQYITWKYPNRFITSGSLGVMGFGLPSSIGVQLAKPGALVIDIDGDSSFMMTMSDLKTIKEHNLPIKIMIMNNHSQKMVEIWEKLFFEERYTATKNKCNPSFVDLAESFGIKGIYCNQKTEVESTLQEAIAYDGPVLCEFDIIGDECLPLMAPGKALDDLILYQEGGVKEGFTKDMLPPS
jgi:acetolactate synthase I/II/III large subunit